MRQRREILRDVGKVSAVGALSAAATGQAAASRSGATIHGVDTRFDPGSKEEIRKFFERLGRLEGAERREVQKHLGEKQVDAVVDVLKSIEVEVDLEPREDSDGGFETNYTDTVSARVHGEHWAFSYTLWEFEYEITWDYDYEQIADVTHKPSGNTYDYSWNYDGLVYGGSWNDIDSDEFECRRQGKFSYLGAGPLPSFESEPWITLSGNSYGYGVVVDTGNGT